MASLINPESLRDAIDEHAIVSATDSAGNIIFANQKFLDISGYSLPEVLGKNHRILKSGVHPASFYQQMWDTLLTGKTWHGEVCNRRKDGELYWVRASVKPILDGNGLPVQYISIRTDITETEAANVKLRTLLESNNDDLDVANNIMSHIMRSEGLSDPQIRCFQRASNQFSGDIVAAARDGNGDLRIMLADVTGHGLQAALFLLPISRVFYSMVKRGFKTGDIASEMNQTMREITTAGRFIAAAVAHIARDGSSIEVWNGGIPTVVHVQRNGELHNFNSQHLPLGILNKPSFDATTEVFQAQSGALLICSDGLTEAENSSGEPFGEAILHAIALISPPDELFNNLITALDTHLGTRIAHDDLSIVLAQCSSKA